jgi:superfamily I DNA and/or RNA helicase
VDAYQGKENRIIILSTVRNNARGISGFLHAPNRVNVSLSRAMERLVIVGSKAMWNGRNSSLPLGQVFGKVESFSADGIAAVVSAEEFLR